MVFQEFVRECLDENVFPTGDVFIVDNCTIHYYDGNEYIKEVLWEENQIIYHNPLIRCNNQSSKYLCFALILWVADWFAVLRKWRR